MQNTTPDPRPIGPEWNDSGDPEWIEAELKEGGAYSGIDMYVPWGRWRERIFDDSSHPADANPLVLGRVGLRRATHAVSEAQKDGGTPEDSSLPDQDPVVQALLATYEALEWIHSLDEHLKLDGRYGNAVDVDPLYGAYVEGAIGARNASHHGLRRVLSTIPVARPIYKAQGDRWVHTGAFHDQGPLPSLRWRRTLPPRMESGTPRDARIIYSERQLEAFHEHMAGREVTMTLYAVIAFFYLSIDGRPVPPEFLSAPSWHPPTIDPRSLPGGIYAQPDQA